MSTPITVTPDTPIREVISHMSKNQIGSVLIVDQQDREKLVGIFTERDVLVRFDSLSAPGGTDRPISTVMTRDVKTIDVARMKYAASMMVQNNFRHLPVTEKTKDNGHRLVAVISMRDLLQRVHKHFLEKALGRFLGVNQESSEAKQAGNRSPKGLVGVLSMDWAFRKMLANAFDGVPGISFKRVRLAELPEKAGHLNHLQRYSFLLFDLDDWRGQSWANMLGELARQPKGPIVMIFLTPGNFDAKVLDALQRLSRSKRFSVYSKPVDYFGFIQNFESASSR